MNKDIENLESRIATLESLSQKRQSEWDEVVSGWKDVLLQFCQDYGLNIPDQLKQIEQPKKGGERA